MPALQELLQDIEFDQFDLEQLAESLLEDVSSNLEANVPASIAADAQSQSRKQPVPQPLVGSDDSRMESSEDSSDLILLDAYNDFKKTTKKTTFNETYEKSDIIYADEIPVEEECLEIDSDVCLAGEPMDGLISPIHSHNELLKSPMHSISDYGYESHDSPHSVNDFSFGEQPDDLNYLLNDLFPALA